MTSRRGIDYSKWDKMDFSDDSEDDGSDEDGDTTGVAARVRPRVTKLDGPTRVTRESGGTIRIEGGSETSSVTPPHGYSVAKKRPITDCGNDGTGHRGIEPSTPPADAIASQLTRNGGWFVDAPTSSRVYWSQNREEVEIAVVFDTAEISTRDLCVKLTGALPYLDRKAAVGGEACGRLVMSAVKSSGERKVLLDGMLPQFIHLAEDEEEVEWEIDKFGKRTERVARVTLRKAVPMNGLFIWWDQPLAHCPKIDVSCIEDRYTKPVEGVIADHKSQQVQIKEVWDEAHRMFREKIQSKKRDTEHDRFDLKKRT